MRRALTPALGILALAAVLILWSAPRDTVGPPSEAVAAVQSASVKVQTTLTISDAWGGERVLKANNGTGVTITADEVQERGYQLNNSTVTLYDAAASGSWSTFTGMYIECDATVDVELCCNDGASEALFVVRLRANQPFMLGDDTSFYTAVGGSMFAGTEDVVDLVRAIELNSTNAHVRVVMWR